MQKKLIISALLASASLMPVFTTAQAAEPAAAPTPDWTFTSNVGLATEYIYRGIGQTNRKPAISGGFDLAHVSGFYIGNWNSSISWLSDTGAGVSAPIEMDFYGGYKGSIAESLTFDIGDLYYYYPGTYTVGFTKPHTNEVYGALTFGPVTAKISYSTTNLFGDLTPASKKTDGSSYFELNYAGTIVDGLTFGAHVGHQQVKDFSDASYTDYKLNITKDFSGLGVTAAYVGTNAKGNVGQFYRNPFNKDLGKDRFVLSVAKSF